MKYISGELYHYIQSVQAYIAPPIAAVFLLGLFFKRINARGAMAALVGGFILGMGRLFTEIIKKDLSGVLYDYANLNFLHFCIFLFLACIVVLIGVSLLTPAPTYEKIKGLTYATMVAADKARSRASWNTRDVVLSVIVIVILALVLLYFSPLILS
jgi:SSS family solute:Na+ symporter